MDDSFHLISRDTRRKHGNYGSSDYHFAAIFSFHLLMPEEQDQSLPTWKKSSFFINVLFGRLGQHLDAKRLESASGTKSYGSN